MKHKRILGYSAIGLTLIAVGVAFIKPVSANSILFRAHAANLNNLSVTFSRATSTNSKGSYNNSDYVLTSKLQQSGLDVQASLTNGYAITSGSDVVRLNGASSILLFSIPTNSSGVTYFRKITSISFVYNASYNVGDNYFDVYFSSVSDFSVSEKISVESAASAAPTISNAHYIKIIGDKSHYAYFNSITINYSCAEAPEVVTLSSISISGQTTEFTVGDSFEFGGTVTAHYSDSTSADVTSSATFDGYDMNEEGEQTVTVSYTEGGITETTTYSITINAESQTLSGTYTASYASYGETYYAYIDFDNLKYSLSGSGISPSSNYCLFTYTLSDSSISFTINGTIHGLDGSARRLFSSSSSTNTGSYNSSTNKITIYLYYTFAGEKSASYTFSK